MLDEELQGLEKKRHTKARDRTAARSRLETETMSKAWCRSRREQQPRDFLYSLRKPGSNLPVYEKRSDKMAEIARTYHEGLQDAGEVLDPQMRNEEMDDVLGCIQTTIPIVEKVKLAYIIDQEEVRQAIKDLPDGKAAGTDGLPHEFWKKLVEQHNDVCNSPLLTNTCTASRVNILRHPSLECMTFRIVFNEWTSLGSYHFITQLSSRSHHPQQTNVTNKPLASTPTHLHATDRDGFLYLSSSRNLGYSSGVLRYKLLWRRR
ncbi:hypothetical protein K443DRAFT_12948 [Laccaria amethystina LaAM-08-1]|uniref:Unplaced genomic scaffold K443scaffold_315, whole genome shotgun sequence n=1 Tax=Laccaria amethystina LaAM-08-1 TaxID=1095629 RepID=A0A0C9WIQ1_9AGAR|nr:hypothetical protein K443DRAFT_12948 [Laccaria amethystina LaAM-08-1]